MTDDPFKQSQPDRKDFLVPEGTKERLDAFIAHEMGEDWLTVTGRPDGKGVGARDHTAVVATHLDHRIAMSFLVLGMAAEHGARVDDADTIRRIEAEDRDLAALMLAIFGRSLAVKLGQTNSLLTHSHAPRHNAAGQRSAART